MTRILSAGLATSLAVGSAIVLSAACGRPADQEPEEAGLDTAAAEESPSDTRAAGAAAGDSMPLVVADVGFETPESALHDPEADVYLVSNINGGPSEKDDNGFVSRVAPEGRVLDLRWIDGADEAVTLHAPKGLALRGDSLFVADIDSVRVFHRETGRPLGALGIPGATFLNDVAAGPDGALYVTDTGIRVGPGGMEPAGTQALYRFDASGRGVAIYSGEELGNPNGVAVDAAGPVVVTFGSGKIYRVEADGGLEELTAPPTGQLDGVILLQDGSQIVSSWEGGAIYHITPGGEVHNIWQDLDSPADIGLDARRMRILVPSFNGNRLEIGSIHG